MAETIYRAFTPDLEVRSSARGGDGRTIVGIAVPFDKPQRIDHTLIESFTRGVFSHQLAAIHRVSFARDHLAHGGTLIGRQLMGRDDAAGFYGEWRVSKTPVGEETLELVRDGALSQLSVGFQERQSRRLPNGTMQRVKAHLTEVAVVREGAYGEGAAVSAVRQVAVEDGIEEALSVCRECGTHLGTDRLDQARQLLAALPILRA